MCESDGVVLTGLATEPENASNKVEDRRGLPDQFKTVQGKTVKLIGTEHSRSPVLVSYSTSKLQGNALLNEHMENPAAFMSDVDSMFDEGFLEDENGNEVDSLVLPIDAIDLAPDLRGTVLDCDLRGYEHGFTWLLAPAFHAPGSRQYAMPLEDPFEKPAAPNNENVLSGALKSIISFVKAMRHIFKKSYYFTKMDGHQLFFNAEYGAFRFAYDGVDMAHGDEKEFSERKDELNNCVSAIIIHSLLGWWPHYAYDSLLEFPGKNEELTVDDYEDPRDWEGNVFCYFNKLPSGLQQTIVDCCKSGGVPLEQWEKELNDAVNSIENCVFCGGENFSSSKQCWHCEHQTDKSLLLTKWSIQMEQQAGCIRLSFGRGTLIPGEFFGLSTQLTPYMKLMYNPKNNSLGIKNISNIKWLVTKSEETEDLLPGSITPIDAKMTIEFEGHPEIRMRFMGYEC